MNQFFLTKQVKLTMDSNEDNAHDSVRYAELIQSTKNKLKINIDGFLYIKDKSRNSVHYWICERKGRKETKCTARVVTICVGNQHKIAKFDSSQHNHAGEANKFPCLQACNLMKELAKISNDLPIQIITNVLATTPRDIQPCLPDKNALRQQIKRAKRVCDQEVEPKSLNNFILPAEFSVTLSGVPFAKDISHGNERILLFTTIQNIKWLQGVKFWIMDGTFKILPTLFRQLCSIHAPAGGNVNYQIVPLVYALMSRKTENLHQRLFQVLYELADENNIDLNPEFILTDFEIGVFTCAQQRVPFSSGAICI